MNQLFRNFLNTLRRYKAASLLNIIGLGIAFAAFAVILMQVHYDLTYDRFHPNADRIFRVENKLYEDEYHMPVNARPYARVVMKASPGIKRGGLYASWDSYSISVEGSDEDTVFEQGWTYYTPDILQMFDFRILSGDTTRLHRPGMVLIPKSLAEKFFPGEDAVGKQLIRHGSNVSPVEIAAVFKDFPDNSFLKNKVWQPFDNVTNYNSWNNWNYPFFVQLTSSDPAQVEEDIHAFSSPEIPEDRMDVLKNMRLTSLLDLHFQSDIKGNNLMGVENASRATVYTLLSIAILVVFIAAINFINFSISMVPMRLQAINTRRILGSSVRAIRREMIAEAMGLSLIALLFAYWLVYTLSTTSFTAFLNVDMAFGKNLPVLLITGVVALATGLLAGLYPAFYIVSFQPALVLKGSFGLSPRGRKFRTVLISVQYIISLVLIIGALSVWTQSNYMKHYPLGFEKENLLVFPISQKLSGQPDALREELLKSPSVRMVEYAAGTLVSMNKMGWGRTIKPSGIMINFDILPVSAGFPELLRLHITAGRSFQPSDEQSEDGIFIFNETAQKRYGLTLESSMSSHRGYAEIAGFVRDFHFKPLQYPIEPFAFFVFGAHPWYTLRTAYVRADGADIASTIDYIRQTVHKMDPQQTVVQVDFLDATLGNFYEKEDRLANLIALFSLLAVFISIIGVFGLVLFETQYRRKEIGLRKVHGASISEILYMLNSNFIYIVSVCFVVAAPVAYYFVRQWQEGFAYRSPIQWWIFAVAILLVLAVTVLTVTLQSYRVATANPVHSIKTE